MKPAGSRVATLNLPAGVSVLSVVETNKSLGDGTYAQGTNIKVRTPSGSDTTVFAAYGPSYVSDATEAIANRVAEIEAVHGLSTG